MHFKNICRGQLYFCSRYKFIYIFPKLALSLEFRGETKKHKCHLSVEPKVLSRGRGRIKLRGRGREKKGKYIKFI